MEELKEISEKLRKGENQDKEYLFFWNNEDKSKFLICNNF
jgi:hypothetical protein